MNAVAAILLLLAVGDFDAPRPVHFPPGGRISAAAFEDLSGDGREEILIWRGKRLFVYAADESGSYDVFRPHVVSVAPDALFFGTGQVDRDERTREVVLLTPEGVVSHAVVAGRLSARAETVLPAENLVTGGRQDAVHPAGFLDDLDGDGLPDIVLATAEGFRVHYQRRYEAEGKEGAPGLWSPEPDATLPYAPTARLDVDPPGLTGRIRARVGVPDLLRRDFDGDGRTDLAIEDGRTLRVFPAGEDGRVTGDLSARLDLSALADGEGRRPSLRVVDVNGDRIPDLLVRREDRTGVDLHLGGRPLEEPAVRLGAKGLLLPLRVLDLDGDGRRDVVIPHTPEFGLPTALSVTFSGAITVNASVFLNTGRPDAPFREKPDAVREMRVKIRLTMDDTGRIRADHSLLMVVEADFDGDGRKDLLLREGTDELLLFPGRPGEVFAEDEALAISIPDTAGADELRTSVRDLDGDGRPDVGILYLTADGKGDRLVLLLSGRRE